MSSATTGLVSLFGLDPATYRPHPIHSGAATYGETNCYADVLIELLHARGDEPVAAMGSTLRMDFEGDQWTFFKPMPEDLEVLFGVDIHEMQPYRPLPQQLVEQLPHGRTLIIELDSFFLPDTRATDYRRAHVKSSVAVEAIDPGQELLRYFHNGGLYELQGEDYRGVFRIGTFSDDVLPPYTELVRFDAGPRPGLAEQRDLARGLLGRHLARRPAANPFLAFGAHVEAVLPGLLAGDAEDYHAYAFATVRMIGAGFEVGAAHVDWVLGEAAAPASEALRRIVDGSKVLSFKLARRRAFDPEPAVATLATAWDEALTRLDGVVG
jgi:hypothetical protein